MKHVMKEVEWNETMLWAYNGNMTMESLDPGMAYVIDVLTGKQETPKRIPDTTPTCAGMAQAHYRTSYLGGQCCWKCQSYDIRTHGCATHRIQIHGDAGHVCDRFALDRTRYATLSKQAWEVRGKALQATMEDF